MNPRDRLAELEQLRNRLAALEEEVSGSAGQDPSWPPTTYYTTYHILAGMVLGLIGAASSLLFNMVGAAMVGRHPLELIRVYLTFPLGEKALEVQTGFALASGCCLYLGTGMLLGIPFQLLLTRYLAGASFMVRFAAAGALGVAIWLINFYGILSWLQPTLIGGRWIVEMVPVFVALMTHLVFAWTMVLVSQWGRFTPPVARSAR